MNNKHQYAICTYLCFFVFFFSTSGLYADHMSLKNAIQIVKNVERQISVLEWTADIKSTFIPPTTSQAKGYVRTMSVSALYDFSSKNYRVDFTSSGTEEPVSLSRGLSFNGSIYCTWHGNLVDNNTYRGRGIITSDIKKAVHHDANIQRNRLRRLGLVSGMPGAVYSDFVDEETIDTVRLSDTLVEWEKKGVEVLVNMDTLKQRIHFLATTTTFMEGTKLRTSILFDMKQGSIVEVDLFHLKGDEIVPFCKWQVEFDDKNVVSAICHPRRVVYNDYANYRLDVFEYKEIVINPKRIAMDYSCAIPKGITVEDTLKKLLYKIGDIIDEDRAIDRFMTFHGLTGDIPAKFKRGNTLRYILMGTGLVLIGIAIYQMVQKRRKK